MKIQVMRRLRSALSNLADSVVEDEYRTVVKEYLQHLNLVVERSSLDTIDQLMAILEDRQGLGLSRRRTGQ